MFYNCGKRYKITSVSVDGNRKSAPISIFADTNPSPPTELSTTALGPHRIRLSWRNGLEPVDQTVIKLYLKNRQVEEISDVQPNENQKLFENLEPKTQYRLTMQTIKNGKRSTIVQKVISTKDIQLLPPVELARVYNTLTY